MRYGFGPRRRGPQQNRPPEALGWPLFFRYLQTNCLRGPQNTTSSTCCSSTMLLPADTEATAILIAATDGTRKHKDPMVSDTRRARDWISGARAVLQGHQEGAGEARARRPRAGRVAECRGRQTAQETAANKTRRSLVSCPLQTQQTINPHQTKGKSRSCRHFH